MMGLDADRLRDVPLWIIAFLITAAFHEAAHAWTAYRLGDPTAANQGRLTLNPLVHIDPTGFIFLIIMALSGFGIGWAKPVPVNPNNFRNPRQGNMLVSLSGPLTNVLIAAFFVLLFKLMPGPSIPQNPVTHVMLIFLQLNIILAAFNLIPIYPLDGSHVVEGLLPENLAEQWEKTYPYGWIVLFALLFTGGIFFILRPFQRLIMFVIGLG